MPAHTYPLSHAPTRATVDALPGTALLEFGAPWCPHCQAAQPAIAQALQGRSDITHLQIVAGQGQALGRSFHVRLWPTLIVLQHGQELARVVRPATAQAVQHILPLPGS